MAKWIGRSLLVAFFALGWWGKASSAIPLERRNVLFIAIDDLNDWVGCLGGHPQAQTPNMDRLAREGLVLTSFYSTPTCTPTRASIMTGRLPIRTGLLRPTMYGEKGGLEGEITAARLLSDAGYVTQATGKWHIGENKESQPHNVGFDDFYGFLSVSDMYTEWRDYHHSPEIVSSPARLEMVNRIEFNKNVVHARKGGDHFFQRTGYRRRGHIAPDTSNPQHRRQRQAAGERAIF